MTDEQRKLLTAATVFAEAIALLYSHEAKISNLEVRNAELLQKLQELEGEHDELKWALSAHLAVALDDPILENNLQKTVFRLEAENAKLRDSLKSTLESHDKEVKDIMVEYTKVIEGLKKRLELKGGE